jgi:prepilin-type N-terminal cleavage/methylation domain-containing protein
VRAKNDIRGFTTVELVIVVAVVAILLMLAAPSMWNFFESERRKGCIENIASGIKEAQNHAMKVNDRAIFVLGSGGWTVTDPNLPAGAQTVSQFDWSGLKWCSFTQTGNTLVFDGMGRIDLGSSNLLSAKTIDGKPDRGIYDWRVEISNAQAVRVCRPDLVIPPNFTKTTDPRTCRSMS